MYSVCNNQLMLAGFPHSEISGSKSVCRLPGAYRRLQRLSSPLTAKASTVCASSLDHITPSNLVIVSNVKTTFAENLQLRTTNFTLTKLITSESNYHIPKFLKNDFLTGQRPEINIHLLTVGMLISELLTRLYMVEPSGIEPLTSCVQGRRSPS
jgi:hypothetical protein